MKNNTYENKDIGVVCPITSCRGKLKKIKKTSKDYTKYTCSKCERSVVLDKNGCGKYD